MSYCRHPIYLWGDGEKLYCAECVFNPTHNVEEKCYHEELKILEVPKGKTSNEVAFEHMVWHIKQYKEHKEFDRAEFLTAQLYDEVMRREGGFGFLRRLFSWWYNRVTWKIDEKYDLD